MSIPLRRDYYDTGIVNLQMRDRGICPKSIKLIKCPICPKCPNQLVRLLTHGCKVNQIESIKMGMSSKIVLKKMPRK